MPIRWELTLVGSMTLRRIDIAGESDQIVRFRTEKTASLLAYLASPVGRTHTREALCDRFWPDASSPEAARASLRTALTSLRKQLEPQDTPRHSVLETRGNARVRLNPETVTTDVERLEGFVRDHRISEANVVLRGEFLEGIYDEWAIAERQRVAQLLEKLENAPAPSPAVAVSPSGATQNQALDALTLPPVVTRGFGSETLRREMAKSLSEGRLWTLIGPAGIGKTRLAIEVAHDLSRRLSVEFVPLAGIASPEQALLFLRERLCLPPTTDSSLAATVEQLRERPPFWLVLDNLEHLLPSMAPRIQSLLEGVPHLSLLVTSRRRLALRNERLVSVAPLTTPPEREDNLETLARSPSLCLLLDRTRQVRPDFALTARNAAALAEICRRLEGIPLALELAAAWLGTVPAQKLLEQLPAHLPRTPPSASHRGRHRSLWRAIQWSYDLLPPELQRTFRRLSIFRGEWTVTAAEAVLESPTGLLETLARLRERSLLELRDDRYYLLVPLREFGESLLDRAERRELAARHARHYLEAERHRIERLTEDTDPRDGPDLHGALERFASAEDGAPALLYLVGWLYYHWWRQGLWDSWTYWVDRASLRRHEVDPSRSPFEREALVMYLKSAGNLAHYRAEYRRALDSFREAEQWCTTPELNVTRLSLISSQLQAHTHRGDLEAAHALAEPLLEQLRRVAPSPYNTSMYAIAASAAAELARCQGEPDRAEALNDEADRAWRTIPTATGGRAQVAAWQGRTAFLRGDYARALELASTALEALTAHGARSDEVRIEQGRALVALNRTEEARRLFAEGLAGLRRLGARYNLYRLLRFTTELLSREGRHREAAALLGAIHAQRLALDLFPTPINLAEEDRLRAAARRALGERLCAQVERGGRSLSLDDAFRRAEL